MPLLVTKSILRFLGLVLLAYLSVSSYCTSISQLFMYASTLHKFLDMEGSLVEALSVCLSQMFFNDRCAVPKKLC